MLTLIGALIFLGTVVAIIIAVMVFLNRNREIVELGKIVAKRAQEPDAPEAVKKVSDATSIYLPRIQADFPDFNWGEYKNKTQSLLHSYFMALGQGNPDLLTEGAGEALREAVAAQVADNATGGLVVRYDDVAVGDTAITDYRKMNGLVTITTQSAVGFKRWIERDGKVVSGNRTTTRQTRFNAKLTYIQDADMVDASYDRGKHLTCPQCGGPIKNLGQKYCEYCGTGIVEYVKKVWVFTSVTERQ